MNLLIYLIVAAVIGWVATELMHDRSNLLINIVVAVVGAFLAGYFLSPFFKVGTINNAITVPTMLVTLLGSVILLAFVNELARQDGRKRLVDSVAGTVTGVLVATAAAGWVASERIPDGTNLVVAGAVSLAFASFVSFGAGVSAMSHREWATALATTTAGVVSGAAVAAVMPSTTPLVGAFLGLGTGMLIASLDALFHRLPALRRRLAGCAAVVLPVAVSGILVYVVGRVLG